MKRIAIFSMMCWTVYAGAVDREAVLKDASAYWSLGNGGQGAQYPLTPVNEIKLNQPVEGASAVPGAKVAVFNNAYFDAGKQIAFKGNAITVYLRARDPKGTWGTALFAKRGFHTLVQFNLFSIDLPKTPGADIGFEIRTEQGFTMLSFPVSAIDPTAWHDFAGRYDGNVVELLCDGKVMARRVWRGFLNQNNEPLLIGAETDHGRPARFFTGEMEEAALWARALTDDELATVMRKDKIMSEHKYVSPYASPVHYRPAVGRLADTIPFFWKGDYHIFYLRALEKVPWEHIVSKDLVHWKELPTALLSDGAKDGPDGLHMFTGSVTEHKGLFHIFYTGWNPENKEGREKIMHATSPDLVTWTKHPEDGFFAKGVHYANTDFRDPFLFWNEAEQQFWMIVCARDAKTTHPVQGVLKSKDILHWEEAEPLIFDPPLGEGTPECPDLFKIDDTYYLIDSPSAGTTDMRYAKKIEGPYRIPETASIDTPILYAAKRMFDGKRHIITGWIRDLRDERDGGDFEWGGDQSVPREVYAGPDGMLLFKPVPEATAMFTNGLFENREPIVLGSDTKPFMKEVPDNYMLQCTVMLDAGAEFTLGLRTSAEKDTGYRLILRPAKREATIKGAKFDYPRTVAFKPNEAITLQVFVQGSIIECFINNAYAFSCRAYDFRSGGLEISAKGAGVSVEQLSIKTSAK